jgi:DNA-binding MarR family transcriptional regulator
MLGFRLWCPAYNLRALYSIKIHTVKVSINGLNKAFENRLRIGIMSTLAVNDSTDFKALKEFLDATDGNLASHLKGLEKEGYIAFEKSFINRVPNTRYSLTANGRKAFTEHINALDRLIRMQQ